MSLKPDNHIIYDSIEYFMNETGTKGGVVVAVTGTNTVTGSAMDDSDRRVTYASNPSGHQVIGMLMSDVVNIDLTRQKLNEHKNEVQVGSKVYVLRRGWAVTNMIMPGQASGIDMPATAYVGPNGYLVTDAAYNTSSGYPTCGRFLTNVDADGYAKIDIYEH